ncbi:MAG: FlgD immunoglobulin-like domain containing protein [Candidatus Zixiibacteriota bacterium]
MTFAVISAILALPAMLFAASDQALVAGKPLVNADRTITVPLSITNQDNLMAIDIPLKFSDGVTLKEVNFENTRVSYFDLKVAKIDNANKNVVIGLVSQLTPTRKPELSAGTGPVANLVFEVKDPSVSELSLETVKLVNPHHSLLFIYHTWDQNGRIGQQRVEPTFDKVAYALTAGSGLPQNFDLKQNYPNPFNPSTEISFDLPVASKVELTVYNVLGQQVRTLVNEEMTAGSHVATWDGRATDGNQVASGVYFYRISAERFEMTKKMLLLK